VFNKCSAVAEMGDRFATIDMGRDLRTRPCSKHTMVSYVVNYSAKDMTLTQQA